jgi:pimeloyl-ACP methyl ester carboxylesterase
LRTHHGQQRFVLCGSCFDGRTALSAFNDEGGAIDGLVFMVAPAMELFGWDKANADKKNLRHILWAIGRKENWKALTNASRWRYMAMVVMRVLMKKKSEAQLGQDLECSSNFKRDFAALVRSRARALFIYGADDSVYGAFRPAERKLLPALDPASRERITLEIWPGHIHGFVEMPRQREVLARVLEWIEGFHARTIAAGDPARGSEGVAESSAAS